MTTRDIEPKSPFVTRWSARKLAARRGEDTEDVERAEAPSGAVEAEGPPTEADLPPLESLGEDSDYSGFLSPKVSASLRKAALRKLFRSPGLSLPDGLDDYAEDFTAFSNLGEVITADMRHRMEAAARRLLEEKQETVEAAPEQLLARATDPAPGADSPAAEGTATGGESDRET